MVVNGREETVIETSQEVQPQSLSFRSNSQSAGSLPKGQQPKKENSRGADLINGSANSPGNSLESDPYSREEEAELQNTLHNYLQKHPSPYGIQ